MNDILLVVALVAAVDPMRSGVALRRSGVGAGPGATAALVALGIAAGLAFAGDSVLDALDVRPESWRIAAGIVAGFTGVRRLVAGPPVAEPILSRFPEALIPGVFPVLVRPVLVMLVVAGAVDLGVAVAVAGAASALGLAALSGRVGGGGEADRLWLAGSHLLAAVLVVAAVVLIISGIADI